MSQPTAKGQTMDLGSLLIEDPRSLQDFNPKQLLEQTKDNFCTLVSKLFDLKKE